MSEMETIEIGGTPCNEACAATGVTENASSLNRLECQAYIEGLRRKYGNEPEGAELRTKGNPHDYGTYYEVVCRFASDKPDAREYAERVESGLQTWFEVGMWTPVMYDDKSQPISIIRDPALWLQETNPGAHATKERRDAAALVSA